MELMDWATFWMIHWAAVAIGMGWSLGVAIVAALIKLISAILGGD